MPDHEISCRAGRIEGCPHDQWVITIPGLWEDEEIGVIETTLRARLQEHYDHFQEFGFCFWKLSVNYIHTRFEAQNHDNKLEARSAEALADAITQDYAALRRYWEPEKASAKSASSHYEKELSRR